MKASIIFSGVLAGVAFAFPAATDTQASSFMKNPDAINKYSEALNDVSSCQ